MDFPQLTQELLVKTLGGFGVSVGQDENGVLGAGFPNAVAQFYLEDNSLTIQTIWNQAVEPEQQEETLELLNSLNSHIPTGKITPIVVEGMPTISVQEQFFAGQGLSAEQLAIQLDAYFQTTFTIFEDFEQRGIAQNAQA